MAANATGMLQSRYSLLVVSNIMWCIARRSTVTASKEVILSAGSIGTPQILMLSGIGNCTTLKTLGIDCEIDLLDVGEHLQDHPLMSAYFTVDSNSTFDDLLRNATILEAALAQWMSNHSGILANAPGNAIAFLRLPSNDSIFKTFTDPTAGMRRVRRGVRKLMLCPS